MKASVMRRGAVARALAVLCTLLWGTAFPFIKLGYRALSVAEGDVGASLLFAGLRFSLAGLMVLGFLCAQKRRFVPLRRDCLAPVLLLGGFQTLGQYLFTYIGIGFTTGANTSIITACASFLTVLAAPLFFRSDRLTPWKIAGCVLGFGGVLVMNGGGGFSAQTLPGDALIFGSTVFAAGGNIIAKKTTQGRDPVTVTAYQLLLGGAGLCGLGLLFGGSLRWNVQGVLILLWLALVSAAAFSIWTALLKLHAASKISVFNLLVPVFGAFLSGVLLGESVLRWETLLSLSLIAAGILLVNISKGGEQHD